MKASLLRKMAVLLLMAVLMLAFAGCNRQELKPDPEPQPVDPTPVEDERFCYITFHAGEDGCFGEDEKNKELKSLQLKGDIIYEDAVPRSVNPKKIFLGWAKSPDATEPDVAIEMTYTEEVGNDVYAIYTDTVHVEYNCMPGYYETEDGGRYPFVLTNYKVGAHFQEITPQIEDPRYRFRGWYTGTFGSGTRYTSDTVIDREVKLNAYWTIEGEAATTVYLDDEFHTELEAMGAFYKFTPEEDAIFDFYAHNYEPYDETFPYIRILAENNALLADSSGEDGQGYVNCYCEMEAGKTYYVTLADSFGRNMSADFGIKKPQTVNVTFHANGGDSAWFDDDKTRTEKTVKVPVGKELGHLSLNYPNLVYNYDIMSFQGWMLEPDGIWDPQAFPTAEADMDLYAYFVNFDHIILDANGGYFRMFNNATEMYINYSEDDLFMPENDPFTDDRRLKFAGWARTPDAKEPNVKIGWDLCQDLPARVYAVYTDRILHTLDANGGYFMMNPANKLFKRSKGVGHVFYGMAVYHEESNIMKCVGWVDQNGVEIPFTPDVYPDYTFAGDTYMKAIWLRTLRISGNGGYFLDDEDVTALKLQIRADEPFEAEFGEPKSLEEGKVFAGWAKSPDAEKPDVFVGQTSSLELTTVYAIWKNKE